MDREARWATVHRVAKSPHDDWISALSGRGRETSFFSLPHEDTFEPGREFSAESEHAVP